ncbi:beta-glucosidase [Stackebrandtia nassauensis]|uniref:Glycoside hydrolase family 3 domain protein n=1 Tax=Stackebrandtia nassauensis (strain DSM 44728 / CIP 108903 / NRRL B-16338 / NBRC 102104 / LLR-40K-21) TaxID=446470 RepID=D3Q6C8_STANL|nr:glycoside hydrolase family 3 C-terminal domain-containing protein [Stackebrandtia nassauensis]ADD42303.1 glycoside hydrolase family 3 domain protein [Stackebrandtia nassauensis DSM 44728]
MNDLDRETLITTQLAVLSLADKVRLLTGASSWRLHAAEAIGLRQLVVSDGPAGVRGVTDSEAETGASFPSPTALAATWDVGMAERLGVVFASEGERHGVDVVLGPVVNLQRTPVGGRHFECFSEDPLLTARIAATLVASMQEHGIGGCVKHFVANDSETARTEYVARVDERTLREVYLAPFEAVVRDAGVWTVMAAYNGVDDGVESNSATEHHNLLTGLLKREWGFDGVVVSDWTAATSTSESANAGLDLVMPGPGGPWEDALLKAVQRGEVGEDVIDDKVRRILRLAHRRGAVNSAPRPPEVPRLDATPALRELAARSIVVLKDDERVLPRAIAELDSVALIGPNAVDAFLQGGGSCYVRPDHIVTPEQGMRSALGTSATLSVHRGGYARPHLPELDLDLTVQPDLVEPGIAVEFLDENGTVVETLRRVDFNGWVRHVVPEAAASARLRTRVRLSEPGRHWLGVGTVGVHRIRIDGRLVASGVEAASEAVILDSSVNAPPSVDHPVDIERPRLVEIEAELQIVDAYGWGRFVRAALRHQRPGPTVDEEIAEAVAAARAADLAVVVVGTNDQVESEGWDRPHLELPGRQDELVRRVAEANPNTVVVVNAGSPVLLPWLSEVNCVLWNWFPGQECGDALADVLFGRVEPSGRLPWTLPASPADVPVPHAIPSDGIVDYAEGIHIGYRAYARDGITPAAAFGHGLGWTDWDYRAAAVAETADGGAEVTVTITNTGPRAGREVVQVYLSAEADGPERPARWLAGFAVADVDAGSETSVPVTIARRAFEIWDTAAGDWRIPSGGYRLHIGRSIQDTRLTLDLHL